MRCFSLTVVQLLYNTQYVEQNCNIRAIMINKKNSNMRCGPRCRFILSA